MTEPPDIDALLAQLRDRVDQRRADGYYPPGLEDALDAHFQRIVASRPGASGADLEEKLAELDAKTSFGRDKIAATSAFPGGTQLHRIVAKAVSRQTDGVLQQLQEFASGVRELLASMVSALEDPQAHVHADVIGSLDAVLERLAQFERGPATPKGAVADLRRRVDALETAERSRQFRPWFSNDHFEEAFRGSREELLERYQDLAAGFSGSAPVLDIGCGRGEFLDLLKKEGVVASGVELDPELVAECERRGLDAVAGDGLAVLAAAGDGTLGGIALIQVVEHLTPQQLIELVATAYDKLRSGGRIVIETVNPQSLYIFARSFYVDPTHATPVHPAYLQFLVHEAGFREYAIDWRSPPPETDVLTVPVNGDAEAKENIERLNRLLFGPQDYALTATR
jgi:O-antigen chain-terminating methyltransferase